MNERSIQSSQKKFSLNIKLKNKQQGNLVPYLAFSLTWLTAQLMISQPELLCSSSISRHAKYSTIITIFIFDYHKPLPLPLTSTTHFQKANLCQINNNDITNLMETNRLWTTLKRRFQHKNSKKLKYMLQFEFNPTVLMSNSLATDI